MMKYTLSIIIALLFSPIIAVQAEDLTQTISIVPTPVQVVPGEGSYRFSENTVFAVENAGQAEIARNFIGLFTCAGGFTPLLKEGSNTGDVCFIIGCCPFFYTQKECIAHHRLYGDAENK